MQRVVVFLIVPTHCAMRGFVKPPPSASYLTVICDAVNWIRWTIGVG